MMRRRNLALGTIAAGFMLGAAGCGGQPGEDTTTAEATVKGTVMVDGHKMSSGEIIFDPANYKRSAPQSKAPIGKDGTYEVKTLAGQNIVTLGGEPVKKNGILQHRRKTFTAQAGDNTFDLDIETK